MTQDVEKQAISKIRRLLNLGEQASVDDVVNAVDKLTHEMQQASLTITITGVRCPDCGDVIYSRARHDFHRCSCKTVAIDGGFDYVKVMAPDIDAIQYVKFDLKADRYELFQDWNLRENKYGWISKEGQSDIVFFTPEER